LSHVGAGHQRRAHSRGIGAAENLGKGYVEMMMRRAFQVCFAEPAVTAIVIDPLTSNTRAHKFYRRLGFVPEGRRYPPRRLLVGRIELEHFRDFALPPVAVREQALLIVIEFLACLGRELEVRPLDDSVHRAGLLAEAAVDALHDVNIIAGCARQVSGVKPT